MKREIINFITGQERMYTLKHSSWNYFLSAQDFSETITYLYLSRNYSRDEKCELEFGGKFEFAGLYNKKDGEIYCCSYDLANILGDEYDSGQFGQGALKTRIMNLVNEKVCELINNDVKSLDRFEDNSVYYGYDRDLEYLKNHSKRSYAIDNILKGHNVDDVKFGWSISDRAIDTQDILNYLTIGDDFITSRAVKEIEKNHKFMQFNFIKNEYTREAMQELIADIEHPVHYTKRVIDAMNSGDYKTVNVTAVKNGVECTFKIEADCLRRDNTFSYYSSYNIIAKDRTTFYEAFGKDADLRVKDIEKITYGKKVIYNK